MGTGAGALPFPPMATTAKARRSRGRASGPELQPIGDHGLFSDCPTGALDERDESSAVLTEARSVGAAG